MKKKHAEALAVGYITEDIKKIWAFHLGKNTKIDRKLHDLYLEDKEDEDTNEEEIFVLALMHNHLIAPFGKILPQGDIEDATENFLVLAPSYNLQPLYKA